MRKETHGGRVNDLTNIFHFSVRDLTLQANPSQHQAGPAYIAKVNPLSELPINFSWEGFLCTSIWAH